MAVSDRYKSAISNLKSQISNLRFQMPLPQIRPAGLSPEFTLLIAPLGDGGVGSAEKNIRHAHPAKLSRARVLRIFQQSFGECLIHRAVLGSECSRKQTHDCIDNHHR